MLAESFALIVSLIGQYRSEKGNQSQVEYDDFMKWLTKTNHEEVINILDLNTNATIHIKALLNQDHKIFKEKLDKIYDAITAFSSTIEGFGSLAQTLNPNAVLSKQAIYILQQFQSSGASKVIELKMMGGTQYMFFEIGGNLVINDERFVEDDFQTLIEYGLLRYDYSSEGSKIYIFTRAASRLVGEKNQNS